MEEEKKKKDFKRVPLIVLNFDKNIRRKGSKISRKVAVCVCKTTQHSQKNNAKMSDSGALSQKIKTNPKVSPTFITNPVIFCITW